jgi:hypothetical protein
MKQKLIYIASPYSHKNQSIMNKRLRDVTIISAKLTKKYGYAMFLPITQSAAIARHEPSLGGDFKSWKSIDIFLVKEKADEVWVIMLKGWDTSIGVTEEIKCARKYQKPIKYFSNTGKLVITESN